MKIFRYKNYDFEKGRLPLGFEWKTPEVIALEPPDGDYSNYEEYDDISYLIDLGTESYKESIEKGKNYVSKIASTLNVYARVGVITVSEANQYGIETNPVTSELNKGFWHSAYYELINITPPKSLEGLHEEVRLHIRDYVNTNYGGVFSID
jgi:hypothetical protein